ncbi:hypothetical protein CJ030_MR4G021073 [Morella rubra]|uniref:Bifunctional inhibitor/plant lipid transfer protein/seed storage helical domain-containing protein n=1 Tax=Morella rubra TaxID=262757 RepID=A0A6A1W0C1_9ROSI|nr:hypothetical protein CJ030_MR4G021073 [Morella rubra]
MQRSIFLGLLFLNLYAKTSVAGIVLLSSNCSVVAESVNTYCVPILKMGNLQAAPLLPCCLALKVVKISKGIFGLGRMCNCVHEAMNSTGPAPPPSPTISPPSSPTISPASSLTISPASSPTAESAGALIVGGGDDLDISIQLQYSCGVIIGFSLDVNVPCPETWH